MTGLYEPYAASTNLVAFLVTVEVHLPEVNELSLFTAHPEVNTNWARRRWEADPGYTLIDSIARGETQEVG